jgi:hypothetical protein
MSDQAWVFEHVHGGTILRPATDALRVPGTDLHASWALVAMPIDGHQELALLVEDTGTLDWPAILAACEAHATGNIAAWQPLPDDAGHYLAATAVALDAWLTEYGERCERLLAVFD